MAHTIKKISFILLLLYPAFCTSCIKKTKPLSGNQDSSKTKITSLKKEKVQDDLENFKNQIYYKEILVGALVKAINNIDKMGFKDIYEVKSDSTIPITVEINVDHHFTKVFPHIIIKRKSPETVFIDIYSVKDNKPLKVFSHEQWALEYVGDTIRDINGDGTHDVVVNIYGTAGCCLKGFSKVFLYRNGSDNFSDEYEFINPTFSSREKIIRGVEYGQPGETSIYKYKWNGENIDTLEYVSFELDSAMKKTGKVILVKRIPGQGSKEVIQLIDDVPTEYKKIEGYDWFVGE